MGHGAEPIGWFGHMEDDMSVRYTDVRVKLAGQDGNAFSILGRVQRALREARIPQDQIHAFLTEAMAGLRRPAGHVHEVGQLRDGLVDEEDLA